MYGHHVLVTCALLGACGFEHGAISGDASVGGDDATDAGAGPADFAAATVASGAGASSLTYTLLIPAAGTNRFLLVSVQLGTNCPSGVVPSITGVTYNGVALAQVATIVGTPCGTTTTRSDQWQLVDPSPGSHNVVVSLSGTAQSIHSGAMAFTGINPTIPVRAWKTLAGAGTTASVTIGSAPGDIVVNTVGQGNSVTSPGAGQTERFLKNVDTSNTLNNSGGSTAPGAAMVTMTWTFGSSDEWQSISSSLRP